MRKLASIKTINEIRTIEGADRIWAYRVDGWWVVDQKEKYEVGDPVVYFEIDSVLPAHGNIAIQGELMGPGIQGNRENLKQFAFYVFDVYDIDKGSYYRAADRIDLIEFLKNQGVNIEHCPVLEPIYAAKTNIDYLLNLAEGPSINNGVREGLVFKSFDNPNFSFKAISNQFLIKNDG